MLILTRKLMEKLYIGDTICVTVVRFEGDQVRLGIDAPREVSVLRSELKPPPGPAAPNAGPPTVPGRPAPGRARGHRSKAIPKIADGRDEVGRGAPPRSSRGRTEDD
jgi:carbon storage regulator